MIKYLKIFTILIVAHFTILSCYAGTDSDNSLSSSKGSNVKDCFEKVNRGVFAFNNGLDKVIFRPIAKGYRHLPSPVRTGTSNVLGNLSNLVTIPNNILQGDIRSAGKNTLRFVINTTIGIVGIFDPASSLGFEKVGVEDYGQTFGSWGVGPGCYLVLPVLGPSTVRDTTGSFISLLGGDPWYNVTVKKDTQYFENSDYYYSKLSEGVDFRAKNLEAIDSLEKNSVDFYASVKSLYLQDRQRKISNSQTATNSMDDSDWEEID